MRRGIIFVICCSFLFLYPTFSLAATGLYGSINTGLAIMSDSDVNETYSVPGLGSSSDSFKVKFDSGYTIGGAVGYMMENLRLEGEISYQENDIDKVSGFNASGDIDALTFLANGYFDFDIGGTIKPFITAGLGFSNVEISEPGFSEDDNVFTYQIGAGVGFALSETVTLDCMYRYLGASDFEYSYSELVPGVGFATLNGEAEIASHNFTLGVRIAFGP